jgi:hypothetical protein
MTNGRGKRARRRADAKGKGKKKATRKKHKFVEAWSTTKHAKHANKVGGANGNMEGFRLRPELHEHVKAAHTALPLGPKRFMGEVTTTCPFVFKHGGHTTRYPANTKLVPQARSGMNFAGGVYIQLGTSKSFDSSRNAPLLSTFTSNRHIKLTLTHLYSHLPTYI